MILRSSACARHRGPLVDLVDRGDRGPLTSAALDHLELCASCEQELTEIALTVAALRRVGSEARMAPVPEISAERLISRIRRARAPWRWRLQLGGLVTSAVLAVVITAPAVIDGPDSAGFSASRGPDAYATWRFAESRIAAAPDNPPVQAIGTLPPRYPDGLLRPWKEVRPVDETRHAL